MKIRLAQSSDYKRIAMALRNKRIEYITPAHAREDIQERRLYVIEDDGEVIAQCALVNEPNYGYYAIKRLVIYNRKNCGRGIARQFIRYFCAMNLPTLGCTPWADNQRMKYLLISNGFEYQYTFLGNYEFFLKRG
jgi:RimJ/RimL family protein N-acetyltransferase